MSLEAQTDRVKARKPDLGMLHLYTFDTLAISTMSAECERVFNSTKKLITQERNRLTEDIIEGSECLKNWWDRGLIVHLDDDVEM